MQEKLTLSLLNVKIVLFSAFNTCSTLNCSQWDLENLYWNVQKDKAEGQDTDGEKTGNTLEVTEMPLIIATRIHCVRTRDSDCSTLSCVLYKEHWASSYLQMGASPPKSHNGRLTLANERAKMLPAANELGRDQCRVLLQGLQQPDAILFAAPISLLLPIEERPISWTASVTFQIRLYGFFCQYTNTQYWM